MRAKKPTREERAILQQHKLDPHIWYVQKSYLSTLQIVNIQTNEVKVIEK